MLKVRVFSFSYLQGGIPEDDSGNGGGFVFDCRFLDNPGKYPEYKEKTGKDFEVKIFLETQTKMQDFLKNVFSIVDEAIEKYSERDFTSLTVSFGCTGGRHRSVYAAEAMAKRIAEKFPNVLYEISHNNLY